MMKPKYLTKSDLRNRKSPRRGLGLHIIMEFYGCDPKLLERADIIEKIMLKAALAARLTVLRVNSHQFSPKGASSMVLIGESHLAIHTWPEYGFAAVDIFVCGGKRPNKAAEVLIKELKPKRIEIIEIVRGGNVQKS